MRGKKNVLLVFLICLIGDASYAQEVGSRSVQEALVKFLNSKEISRAFMRVPVQENSCVIFVDLNDITKGYVVNSWRGFKVAVLKSGPLVDSLMHIDAHHLLMNRCNYYVLNAKKLDKTTTLVDFLNACSNYASSVRIKERNRLFYLGKIENGIN